MTALEDRAFPMLTCADSYPFALRPLTLDETAGAPEADAPAVRPDAPKARRWPLLLIASPAAVAIWSGWVALGAMCGFGPVNLLPGIGSGFTVNTAITLPVGVEAYGAFALGAWLLPGTPERARRFAQKSAVGSLILGMTGQVIYHLLAAAHATRAPWPVTVVVACMPVATLGFGAALAHLMHAGDIKSADAPETHPAEPPQPTETSTEDEPGTAPAEPPASAAPDAPDAPPRRALQSAPERPARRARKTAPDAPPETRYADEIAAGNVPSLRRIQADFKVGRPRAVEIRAALKSRTDADVVPIGARQA
jgi:hypothetical protein